MQALWRNQARRWRAYGGVARNRLRQLQTSKLV